MTLHLQNVTKAFATPSGPRTVLHGVSLDVDAGEVVHLDGASGSGKSTLINVCGLLTPPTDGRVVLGGVDCTSLDDRGRTRLRADEVGFIFQSHHLLPELTSVENVRIAAVRDEPAQIEARLREVGLGDRLNDRTKLLSGGQQQRVAVVRALVNRPSLVLADEPISGLDEESGLAVLALLAAAADSGAAVVIASHDARVTAIAARTVTLRDGRVA